MNTELKPCPFCGPGESVVSLYFDDVAKRHRVGCGRCGASSGIHPRSRRSEHAVKAWNLRAALQEQDREDSERLDWLAEQEAQIRSIVTVKGVRHRVGWPDYGEVQSEWFMTAREAIDHARRKGEQTS